MRVLARREILIFSAVCLLAEASRGAEAAVEEVRTLDKFEVRENNEDASGKFDNKASNDALAEIVAGARLQNPNAQTSTDLLKNTAGVTVKSGGGTSSVSVRGIDQRMLRITVDGQRQGGTGNALDSIPPEIVQSLEVTKTFTPDMEADAVGAVINVSTGGTVIAKGYEQGRQQITFNPIDPRPGTRNTFSVARQFRFFAGPPGTAEPAGKAAAPNASFLVTLSLDDAFKTRERLSDLREWPAQVSPGPDPFTGRSIPVLTLPLIESTLEHRQHQGVLLSADARVGTTAVFWRSNFNRDWSKRNRDFNDTNPAAGTPLLLTPTAGLFSGVTQSRRNQHQISQRDSANLSFGGNTKIGRTETDATLGYSLTREFEPHTLDSVFLSDHTYRAGYDVASDAFLPIWSHVDEVNPADTASLNDPAHYRFSYLSLSRIETRDEELSAKFNARINLSGKAGSGNYLKFGGKLQERHRAADTDRDVYGPGPMTRDMLGLIGTPEAVMGTVAYRFGPVADSSKVARLVGSAPEFFQRDALQSLINSRGGDYTINEAVWAAYGMGKVKLGLWTLLGGLRIEGTRVKSKANQMAFDASGLFGGFTPARVTNSYTEVLPGLHLRYDPAPGWLYRASVTRSLSRPAYIDIPPFRTLSFLDRRSRSGAPGLKPYQSTNLDLSLDRYTEATGLLSFAVFYKKIDHFITDAQSPVTFGSLGQFIDFRRVNGQAAFAMGFEGNWQSPSWDLGAGLGRGSIEANYSFNHGEAHHPTRPGETFPLPRQVDHQASLKFHGEHGKVSVDGSVLYHTGWWEDLIAPGFDNMNKGAWDAELGAVYKIGKNTRLTVSAANLVNTPTRRYAGSATRMNDYQLNGPDFTAGFQWKM